MEAPGVRRSAGLALDIAVHTVRACLHAGLRPGPHLLRAVCFPVTVTRLWSIAKQELAPSTLDDSLEAVRRFHREPERRSHVQRPWSPVAVQRIHRDQVIGATIEDVAAVMHVAIEAEDPIEQYSGESGEALRLLLPSLARFMGRAEEHRRYAREHGLPWCSSSWCEEEKRHAPMFAQIVSRLTGSKPSRDNPNAVASFSCNEQDALRHLVRREASEWNTVGSYAVLVAHSRGELRTALLNLLRDEVKHLAILSAADRYLLGPRSGRRLRELIEYSLYFVRYHETHRSAGRRAFLADPAGFVETTISCLLAERQVRRWLRTLSPERLLTVFEVESRLPALPAIARNPDLERREQQEAQRLERARRMFARWPVLAEGNPAWSQDSH